MAMALNAAQAELELIESDDTLHDFAGPHSGKGNDFAHYWVMLRAIELEKQKQPDYVLICEYVQDVAEFDSTLPTRVHLYQLKKKEGSYWTASDLTGQTKKDKTPKAERPLYKLLAHTRKFKSLPARGVFISNAKFDVTLSTGQSSVNETTVALDSLDAAHTAALKTAIALAEGVPEAAVDLSMVEMRHTPLAIDDLQRHMNGVMLEYLAHSVPEHSAQASSLVDTLFSRIKARARRTEKCSSWPELLDRRGFTRASFVKAVGAMESIPDKAAFRDKLLEKVGESWHFAQRARIIGALAKCAREKILFGEANRWAVSPETIASLCESAQGQPDPDTVAFQSICSHLVATMPELRLDEINALAIYEMTEWMLNQTPA